MVCMPLARTSWSGRWRSTARRHKAEIIGHPGFDCAWAQEHGEAMNSDELVRLTVAEAAALIATRKLSPVELTQGYLQRIRRFDPLIRSFLLVTEEPAL